MTIEPPPKPLAALPPTPQTVGNKILWWLARAVVVLVVLVFVLIGMGTVLTWNDLPGCDSKAAKDTLSDEFQRNNLALTRYNEVKTVSSAQDEIVCSANLAIRGGGTLDVDYRFYRAGSEKRYEVRSMRRNPA